RRPRRTGHALRLVDLPGLARPLRSTGRAALAVPFARGAPHLVGAPPGHLARAGRNQPSGRGRRLFPPAAPVGPGAGAAADAPARPARRGHALLPPLGARPGAAAPAVAAGELFPHLRGDDDRPRAVAPSPAPAPVQPGHRPGQAVAVRATRE